MLLKRTGQRTSGRRIFLMLLVAHMGVWILLPSLHYQPDGLDELLLVEGTAPTVLQKHPAAEPALWSVMQFLHTCGFKGRALRPTQIWNGIFMTLALGLMGRVLRRYGLSWGLTTAIVFCLGGLYVVMQLSVDPYMFYWPPSLALLCTAILLSKPSLEGKPKIPLGRAWLWSLLTLTTMMLFNPMTQLAIPAIALCWWWNREGSRRAWGPILRSAALFLIPALDYAIVVVATGGLQSTVGPYGQLTSMTVPLTWRALLRAIVVHMQGASLLGAFLGKDDPGVIVVTAAVVFLPATVIVYWNGLLRRTGLGSRRETLLWLLTALVSAIFIIWWAPGHGPFWILPIWLSLPAWAARVSAVGDSAEPRNRRWHRDTVMALTLQGVLLWVANLGFYVAPASRGPCPYIEVAESIQSHFGPQDVLVYPVFPRLDIDYFARRHTTGLLPLYVHRRPGWTTFDELEQLVYDTRWKGGRVYLLVPASREDWVPEIASVQTGVDYDLRDFERIRWGRSIELGGNTYRQVFSIAPEKLR